MTLSLPPNITEAHAPEANLTSTTPLKHYDIAIGRAVGAPLDLISNVGEFGGP
jgi:hypothetical protein